MWTRIWKILKYAGTEEEKLNRVKVEIAEGNRLNLRAFAIVGTIGMAAMILASFFDPSLEKNRFAYIFCTLFCLFLILYSETIAKKNRVLVYVGIYAFINLLLLFGIILGTFVEPNEVSVSYPILLFATPLLFIDIPLRMNLVVSVSIVVYLILARMTQTPLMFSYNLSNVVPYGIIAMVASSYMMEIKVKRYILEDENRYLSESDQLTGLLNRRSYEQHLTRLRQNKLSKDLFICEFDVNGLKNVNDNLGHAAGDELIQGAANCIEAVFGRYGRCYRIGGDEFMAILEGSSPTEEELLEMFNLQLRSWKGTLVSGLSVSIGIVSAQEEETVDQLVIRADQKMYADKFDYYSVDLESMKPNLRA